MPREASIDAVLHPAKTKALYFVAAGVSPKEGHVFSSSLKAHNQAVADYRRKLREYRNEAKKNIDKEEPSLAGENKTATVVENQASKK